MGWNGPLRQVQTHMSHVSTKTTTATTATTTATTTTITQRQWMKYFSKSHKHPALLNTAMRYVHYIKDSLAWKLSPSYLIKLARNCRRVAQERNMCSVLLLYDHGTKSYWIKPTVTWQAMDMMILLATQGKLEMPTWRYSSMMTVIERIYNTSFCTKLPMFSTCHFIVTYL